VIVAMHIVMTLVPACLDIVSRR